jgi:hypothetical protein
MQEHGERKERHRCHPRDACRRGTQRPAESVRGQDGKAEHQAASDGNEVEEDVVDLPDPVRDEPLKPLLRCSNQQAREHGQQHDRRIAERTPGPVEEKADESILQEVKPLDGVALRVGAGVPGRVGGGNRQGGDDSGVTLCPPFTNLPRGGDESSDENRGASRADDENEVAGKRRAQPRPQLPDEWSGEHHGHRHQDREREGSGTESGARHWSAIVTDRGVIGRAVL